VRGPILPGLLGLLMLVLGREVEGLAWAVRLLALANPLLMYFLIKRIAGSIAGLLAAAMVAVFGYTATLELAFSIDVVQLTVFLLSVLVLLIAAQKNNAGLSLLSGLLLGAAILTKETSFVILPLALFTMLLFGWSFRGLLLHYAGVAVVSLPWWIWVWAVSGEVYIAGRLPSGLVIPVIATLTLTALFLVRLHRSNIFARFQESERGWQWAGWLMVLVSAAAFSVLLLGTSNRAEALRSYGIELLPTHTFVTEQLLEPTPLGYLLPLAGVYVLWKTVRNSQEIGRAHV
jgi:4-amino-4-deoxy-L-arabinose transferase-like glycosyltransferase